MAELNAHRADSCTLFQADLGDPAETARLGREILDRHHRIDLPVNNASGFSPTPIDTAKPDEFDDMIGSNLQRLGEPADIARAVRFLAQDAPFIAGQDIAVDGGRCLV